MIFIKTRIRTYITFELNKYLIHLWEKNAKKKTLYSPIVLQLQVQKT